jgi:phosphoribosylanthranilate isomerase
MTVRVKICGLNDEAAFDSAIAAAVDWVGFVFYPPSPRAVSPARAASLSGRTAGGAQRVGLFVEPELAQVRAVLDSVKLDILQIYGTRQLVADIHQEFGLPVWHAVGVRSRQDLPTDFDDAAAFVIESKAPAGATRPGGNATSFDWSVLRNWHPGTPWLLAGGLTPDNVAAAIRRTAATAVDVSSGVETAPGIKSAALIARFVAAARCA